MNTVLQSLPINSMALGKKLARFSFQWSAIGIFIYLIEPDSSNTLGRSAVTFRMYYKHNHVTQYATLLSLQRSQHLQTVNTVLHIT